MSFNVVLRDCPEVTKWQLYLLELAAQEREHGIGDRPQLLEEYHVGLGADECWWRRRVAGTGTVRLRVGHVLVNDVLQAVRLMLVVREAMEALGHVEVLVGNEMGGYHLVEEIRRR